MKPSQPRAPCFPSRHSFLPGAPLEEGGSSGDRTAQTAPRPGPDAFLKTERGCSFSSTISPFISYVSAISCALGGLGLFFMLRVQTASVPLSRRKKHTQTNSSDMSDGDDDVSVSPSNEPRRWRLRRARFSCLLNGSSVPRRGNAFCLSAQKCVYNLRWCFSRPLTDGHHFCLLRFQRHVHTYRILPDADGLLAVQVSVVSGAEFA